MAPRHYVAVAAATLLTVSLAACDGTGDSDDPPTTPATVSFPDDPNKAPSVPDPIYPTAFIEKPCISLTPEQQKKFDLDSGEADSSAIGEECIYHYANGDRWIRIEYSTNVGGLQKLYENGPQSGRQWKPEVLNGYPAVATEEANKAGVPSYDLSCSYAVGVDDLVYFAVLNANGGSECTVAREIAAEVLSNIMEHG